MPEETIWIERMTSPHVKDAIRNGCRTVLLAVGSTEQHGPHLPTGTDSMIGDMLVERVARRVGNVLVAPTIRVGSSEHHMAFPGTITLRDEVLEEVIVDCCRSLARHGFRTIVVIPTHGGNVQTVNRTAERLNRESISAKVIAHSDESAYLTAMVEVGGKYEITPGEVGTHAGHLETSLMLADYENLVEMDKAVKGNVDLGYEYEDKLHEMGMHQLSPVGILGDATKASIDAGNDYIECMVAKLAEQLREITAD